MSAVVGRDRETLNNDALTLCWYNQGGNLARESHEMNTIILSTETANLPIGQLLEQVNRGGVEVRDAAGNVLAFVLSPVDHQSWIYFEAHREIEEHQHEVRQAIERRGGVTTAQMLAKAAVTVRQARQP